MAIRRIAFDSVGGFDPSYFMYVEDLDLCWRLHHAGWRVLHLPEAEVTHAGGLSSRRHPYRMLAAHHRSTLRFFSRSTTGRVGHSFQWSPSRSAYDFWPRGASRRGSRWPAPPILARGRVE